jgi:hypothetical protein
MKNDEGIKDERNYQEYLNLLRSKPVFAIITSLRSGFIPLYHYKHLTNQIDSSNCLCGESETVHHYLLQCPNYEEEREGFNCLSCTFGWSE